MSNFNLVFCTLFLVIAILFLIVLPRSYKLIALVPGAIVTMMLALAITDDHHYKRIIEEENNQRQAEEQFKKLLYHTTIENRTNAGVRIQTSKEVLCGPEGKEFFCKNSWNEYGSYQCRDIRPNSNLVIATEKPLVVYVKVLGSHLNTDFQQVTLKSQTITVTETVVLSERPIISK